MSAGPLNDAASVEQTKLLEFKFTDSFQKCLDKLEPLMREIAERIARGDAYITADIRESHIKLFNSLQEHRATLNRPTKRIAEFITREGHFTAISMERTAMLLRERIIGQETMQRKPIDTKQLVQPQMDIAQQIGGMLDHALLTPDPSRASQNPYQLPHDYTIEDGQGRQIPIKADLSHAKNSGGYGEIFTGHDKEGNCVALKRLKRSDIHPNELKHFEEEAQIWARLRHPNILVYYGKFQCGNHIYLASPYMHRGSLATFVVKDDRHRVSRFDLLLQLAKALAFMHEHKLIHGDVKAENCLVDSFDQIQVCDFGLAKYEGSYTSFSMIGAGSAPWKSPERWGVSPAPRAPKTDVYSFGMTIAEVLSGYAPFHPTKDADSLRDKILAGHRPNTQPPGTPDGLTSFDVLWKLAVRCWSEKPGDRPPMGEVVNTIENKKSAATKSKGRPSILARWRGSA